MKWTLASFFFQNNANIGLTPSDTINKNVFKKSLNTLLQGSKKYEEIAFKY